MITDATAPWDCWRDGCRLRSASGVAYTGVGMQAMVKAVRAGGARRQPIMLGGLDYAGDLSQWLSHRPRDAAAALVASLHLYEFVPGSYLGGEGRPRPPDGTETPEQARSARLAAWDAVIAPVAERVPIVAGEFGEYDCTSDFSAQWLDWASGHGVSALAWVWNAVDTDADGMADGHWFCDGRSDLGRGGPALIERYDGTPTAFAAVVRAGFCATRAAQGVQPAACPALPAGPRLRVARSARLSTAQSRGLTMRIGCEQACRYTIIVTQRGQRIGRRTGSLGAAGTRTTSVRLSRRARRGTLLIKAIFSATGITPRSLTATATLQR